MASSDAFVPLGRIIRPHGLKGDVIVDLVGADSGPCHYDIIYLDDAGGMVPYRVIQAIGDIGDKGMRRLRIEGVEDRTKAEAIRGKNVFVKRAQLPPLGEGEFYWFDLMGLAVHSRGGELIGTITSIFNNGAHDIYVVNGPAGEILIPAVEDFVSLVDLERGIMLVELPPGLQGQDAL